MTKLTSVMAVAVVTLGGCGGGDSGPGGVQGTVHGTTIQVVDVVSAAISADSIMGAQIVLSTTENPCEDLRANVQHPSTAYVSIFLYDRTGDMLTTPSAPGEYTVFADIRNPPTKAASISVFDVDASCFNKGDMRASATSGTVDLSSVNGNTFDGTFDVTLTTGEHLSGDFAPTACPGLETFATHQAGPACPQ